MNDEYGRRIITTDDLVKELLKGHDISNVLVHKTNEYSQYNQTIQELDNPFSLIKFYPTLNITPEEFHKNNQKKWLIPEEYLSIDPVEFLLDESNSPEENDRIEYELMLFEKTNSLILLNLMIYLVDTFRNNNILWGVGRGSSVSCYCFYKIGIHRVNSLKYNLDPNEFFKVKE